MPEEPIPELAPTCHLIQEIRQCIGLVESSAQLVLYRGRSAVGDDVVHAPAVSVQAGPSSPVLLLAWKLLLPPGEVVHTVESTAVIELPAFSLELRIVRFQDTAVNVVAAAAAHREEGIALDVINLPPQQINHRRPNKLCHPAMPFLGWKLGQHIEVFMVAGYEQGGEGLRLQTVQPVPFLSTAVPDTAELQKRERLGGQRSQAGALPLSSSGKENLRKGGRSPAFRRGRFLWRRDSNTPPFQYRGWRGSWRRHTCRSRSGRRTGNRPHGSVRPESRRCPQTYRSIESDGLVLLPFTANAESRGHCHPRFRSAAAPAFLFL